MNGKERIANILQRKPVDRIGLYEHFWSNAETRWRSEGRLQAGEAVADRFGFDMATFWACNFTADIDFQPIVIEEDENSVLTKDGNGATLRRRKKEEGTPEHVDFSVRDEATWNVLARPKLVAFDPH